MRAMGMALAVAAAAFNSVVHATALGKGGSLREGSDVRNRGAFPQSIPLFVDEKEQLTTNAVERCEPPIYGGRISTDDLLGDPDLLRRRGDG